MADAKTKPPLNAELEKQGWNRKSALAGIQMKNGFNGTRHTVKLRIVGRDGKVDIDLPDGSSVKQACLEIQKAYSTDNGVFKLPTKNYSPIHWLCGRLAKLTIAGWNMEFAYDGKVVSPGTFIRELRNNKK